jgi:sigma-B regulation protein RsbU (phosphoserine phosphatase)
MAEIAEQLVMIDPDAQLAERLCAHLAPAYGLQHFQSYALAVEHIAENPCAAVVLDLSLCQADNDAVRSIRQHNAKLPIILFCSQQPSCPLVKALAHDAVYFVPKPIDDLEILALTVRKGLANSRVLSDRESYRDQLEDANRDLQAHLHLLEQDQIAGRVVQRKLQPHSPARLGGIDISFKIIPSLYLSGDAVDYGLLDNRYLAFYLTDIAGHGAASAFVTVWIKQVVRSLFRERNIFHSRASFEQDAPLLVSLINDELIKAEIGRHLTCFVGVIDTATREMNYVVCGHMPLPLLFEGQRARYLQGAGKPLGLFPEAEWEMHRIQLPENFRLLVFSDGVLETISEQNLIEREAMLKQELELKQPMTLAQVSMALGLDRITAAVDDIASLVIKRDAP